MSRFVLFTAGTLFIAYSSTAHAADPPKSSGDPAARALFYEARSLMKQGDYATACPKLEASLRLEYGIGTEFNLADCSEKLGKLSTAWSRFINVALAAKASNQAERERVARDRAKALEPRVPKLAVDVPLPPPPGLEVKRDGLVVPPASWGTPIPVDPGPHRVTVLAPGRQSWEDSVTAGEGQVVRVSVPTDLPSSVIAAAPELAPAPPAAAQQTEPRHEPTSVPAPVVDETRGSTQRSIGYIVGGLGVAGLAVGAGFGINSLQKGERSNEHCTGDLCDKEGVYLRDKAIQSGDIATVATIAGGGALLGGVILVLTAPKAGARQEPPSTSFRALPHVAANGAGMSLQVGLP